MSLNNQYYNPGQNIMGQLWKLRGKCISLNKLWIHLLKMVGNVVLVNHFFCPPPPSPPLPQAMLSLPKIKWMPDINIASWGGGGGKYVIFNRLLPLSPKSSGQGCSHLWVIFRYMMVKNASEYLKDRVFELRRKIWRHDWSLQLCTELKVHLTPKFFFHLKESTCYLQYYCEKIFGFG